MAYIDADYVRVHYLDGDECTDLFDIFDGEMPFSWISQNSNEDVRLFLHTALSHDGIPYEGGYNGYVYTLEFQGEVDGLGFRVNYEAGEPDEAGFARIFNVCVYRSSIWDREDKGIPNPFEIEYHGDVV